MAQAAILDRRLKHHAADSDLGLRLKGEVEAVLKEAERSQPAQKPQTGHWTFSMPHAGVRYYRF